MSKIYKLEQGKISVNITIVDTKDYNGMYDSKENLITLNKNAPNIYQTLIHELYHYAYLKEVPNLEKIDFGGTDSGAAISEIVAIVGANWFSDIMMAVANWFAHFKEQNND